MFGNKSSEIHRATLATSRGTKRQNLPLSLLAFASLVILFSAGCPQPVVYQPNDTLVTTLGAAAAQERLEDTMLRSLNPRVFEVAVTDKFLHYRFQQPLVGPYGIQTGSLASENRVHFSNMDRIDVYENNVVFIRAPSKQVLAQLIFSNQEDAKAFADLLLSFKARYVSSAEK